MAAPISASYTHCAYCESSFDQRLKTRDHFIPLSKGGTHLESNVFIVCSSCNHFKADFLPIEFIREANLLLSNQPSLLKFRSGIGKRLLATIIKNVRRIYEDSLTTVAQKKRHRRVWYSKVLNELAADVTLSVNNNTARSKNKEYLQFLQQQRRNSMN